MIFWSASSHVPALFAWPRSTASPCSFGISWDRSTESWKEAQEFPSQPSHRDQFYSHIPQRHKSDQSILFLWSKTSSSGDTVEFLGNLLATYTIENIFLASDQTPACQKPNQFTLHQIQLFLAQQPILKSVSKCFISNSQASTHNSKFWTVKENIRFSLTEEKGSLPFLLLIK